MKTKPELEKELERILSFIRLNVGATEKVVIPVSGGLDSDVVARLCAMAIGSERIRLFIVNQEGMEEKYLRNVRDLAEDLGAELAVISLRGMNRQLIEVLHSAAPRENFQPDDLLTVARANVSLRTAIISSYQDKGYLIAGNSNRSEIELGFFLPFGDNLGHFKPIAHLYKSEVQILAELVECRRAVIEQPPSAGLWEGETDMEDMSYWIYQKGPVPGGRVFSQEDERRVARIHALLSQERVDRCLIAFHEGRPNREIAQTVNLPEDCVASIRSVRDYAAKFKNRPLLVSLERI